MSNTSPLMKIMLDVSSKASRFLSRDYYELKSLQASRKSNHMFVEKSLDKIKKVVLNELERARPEFGIVCKGFDKESTALNQEKWIVTLMDGIENFAHSIPCFGISIAVEEKRYSKPEIVSGLVTFPIIDEVYFAEKGQGAWHIGSMGKYSATNRLRVSERKENLMVFDSKPGNNAGHSYRDFGCNILSCAYVACAKVDFAKVYDLNEDDLAAGIILVREAGGVVVNNGDSFSFSNSSLNGVMK